MIFDIITIFPELFESFLTTSLIEKSIIKNLIQVNIHNLRNYAEDKHKTVDDRVFGGGPGMLLKPEPIFKAVKDIRSKNKTVSARSKTILLSPQGKLFNHVMATDYSKYDQLIMICGRYEGVDQRVADYLADDIISIGEYTLSGGEVPAMVITEAVARLIPGVVGNKESISNEPVLYPQYTRPENYKGLKVPKILLSGDHKKISEWRKKHVLKGKEQYPSKNSSAA